MDALQQEEIQIDCVATLQLRTALLHNSPRACPFESYGGPLTHVRADPRIKRCRRVPLIGHCKWKQLQLE